jgi:hypothetical protein
MTALDMANIEIPRGRRRSLMHNFLTILSSATNIKFGKYLLFDIFET